MLFVCDLRVVHDCCPCVWEGGTCGTQVLTIMLLDCDGFAEPSVRSELMEQVPHIAVYCQENKTLFSDTMPTYILPMVVRFLNDANNQVSSLTLAFKKHRMFYIMQKL